WPPWSMACGCAAAWSAVTSTPTTHAASPTRTSTSSYRQTRYKRLNACSPHLPLPLPGVPMSTLPLQQLYIHGKLVDASSGKTFQSINPATGEVIAEVQIANQ